MNNNTPEIKRVCRCYQGCIKYGLNSPDGPHELNENVLCMNDISPEGRQYLTSIGLYVEPEEIEEIEEEEDTDAMEKNDGPYSVQLSGTTIPPVEIESEQPKSDTSTGQKQRSNINATKHTNNKKPNTGRQSK